MHPTIKIAALFPEEVNSNEMGVPIHQVEQFAPRISMGGSISTLPHLAIALTDHPKHGLDLEKNWRRMAIYYAMITGDGWGKVRVLSGFRDPLVTYSLSTGDTNRLNEGLHKLARLLFAAGAERLFPSITGCPSIEQKSVLHLKQPLSRKRTNLMTVHLFSSCPLGENRKLCAVDSFGKLPGQENLYVADASLLPTAPSVNPQGTIMAVARRNVHHYLQKHKA